tara:strand:+ start:814 stop:1005 length:192 start_codon:yes stop_codon:yes gene_type:complete
MALIEFDGGSLQELEDAKTLKAVMFLMIQEITKSTPNDQELGGRIRKIINNYEKDSNTNTTTL